MQQQHIFIISFFCFADVICGQWSLQRGRRRRRNRHYLCQNLYFHLVYILSFSFSSEFASFSCVLFALQITKEKSLFTKFRSHKFLSTSPVILLNCKFAMCKYPISSPRLTSSSSFAAFVFHEKFLDYEPISSWCCCCFGGSNQIKISNLVPSINFIDFRIK